jgi:sporadic carbohydrate cluster protein (TIGR04323 family)
MSNRQGYRGYVASRAVRGQLWPQSVQNLVIRDYAQRNGLTYLLSAVEYAMPGCYMNLETVLEEVDAIEGVLLFSLFMLPERRERRRAIYDRILSAGASLHGALENLSLAEESDIQRIEDIFAAARLTEKGSPPLSEEERSTTPSSRFPPYLAA